MAVAAGEVMVVINGVRLIAGFLVFKWYNCWITI